MRKKFIFLVFNLSFLILGTGLVSTAFAQEVANQPVMSPNNFVLGTIQFFCMALIVYFLMVINPAKAKEQSHNEFIENLKKNDNVFTTAGIYGKVISIKQNEISLEIAPNVKVKFEAKNLLPLPSSDSKSSDLKSADVKKADSKKVNFKK